MTKSFITLIGTMLLGAGLAGMFVPDSLMLFLPQPLAQFIAGNAVALIVIGIVVDAVGTVRRRKQATMGSQARASGGAIKNESLEPDSSAGKAGLEESEADWSPLKSGGANFKTHRLIEVNRYRLEVSATAQMKLFCWIFILMGAGIGGFIGYEVWKDGEGYTALLPLAFGLVFVFVGGVMLHFANRTVVFDQGVGWFWRGDKQVTVGSDMSTHKDAVRLSDIQALQLLSERCTSSGNGSRSSYYSYELNLILNDGKRINVMDHGNKAALVDDAKAISTFLDVPVWNRL